MENVNLSFRYEEQDYVRAMRAHFAMRLRLPLDLTLAAMTALLGAYELGIGMVCLSGGFILILVAAFAVIPRIWFRSQPKLRDEYSLRFSSEGIHFQTVHIDSDLQWTMYTRALVDPYSFILYYGNQQFTLIPKRVFSDGAQRELFERLLSQNVSNILNKTTKGDKPQFR